jgi:hypothetical protein
MPGLPAFPALSLFPVIPALRWALILGFGGSFYRKLSRLRVGTFPTTFTRFLKITETPPMPTPYHHTIGLRVPTSLYASVRVMGCVVVLRAT